MNMHQRGKELAPKRAEAFRLLDEEPSLTGIQLAERVSVARGTAYSWKARWLRRNTGLHPINKEGLKLPGTHDLTWEEVVAACPDIDALALLVLRGILGAMSDKDRQIEELKKQVKDITEDRIRVMANHNALLTKIRSDGHMEISSALHTLVPKSR